jgi:hypothetical protein
VAALYGQDLREATGVIHVTSAWRPPGGGLESLAINDATPRSRSDEFVLALARARADALVTTGRILRKEPDLIHQAHDHQQEDGRDAREDDGVVSARDLGAWRREVLGRSKPTWTVVLTRGAGIDLDHPVLRGPAPRLLYTSDAAAAALAGAARTRGIRLVGAAHPSLRGLLAWLRREGGCACVLVEAGASTSADLYCAPVEVDELLLSVCGAERVVARARGPALPADEDIAAAGLRLKSECTLVEESGPWSFRRYVR